MSRKDSTSSEVEDDDGDGTAMMSMFASYYGIEGSSEKQNKSAAELINTVDFDSSRFVEDLLSTMNIDALIEKDTSMVHEIRTLDSDMQMLVYENYNKFISATETIKRMKTNVEAMDDDMGAVRSKMKKISTSSETIDKTLLQKRHQIDKLVRVRRLLQKLEFLSELPEKLVELIGNGHYKRAVQLYGRTISVLTQHSHLLSFKNIKERTEKMMVDLREKVLRSLNDTTLEAVKLTHYVTILRLMEAPRDRVVKKFLNAHNVRSKAMITDYKEQLKALTSQYINDSKTSNGDDEKDLVGSTSGARKFHQTVIVGLVEACKGITQLFESEKVVGTPVVHTGSTNSSYAQVTKEDIENAVNQLHKTFSDIVPDYIKCIMQAISLFFHRYNSHTQYYHQLETRANETQIAQTETQNEPNENAETEKVSSNDTEKDYSQVLRQAQLRHYDYEEQKQAWFTLARQTILDWDFLDNTLVNCVPKSLQSEVTPTTTSYASTVATAVITVLRGQLRYFFEFNMVCLSKKLITITKEIISSCNILPEVDRVFEGGGVTLSGFNRDVHHSLSYESSVHSGSSGHGFSQHGQSTTSSVGPMTDQNFSRHILQSRTMEIRGMIDRMVAEVFLSFEELCILAKPALDIKHGGINPDKGNLSIFDSEKPIVSNESNAGSVTIQFVMDYVESLCLIIQALCDNKSPEATFRLNERYYEMARSTLDEGVITYSEENRVIQPWKPYSANTSSWKSKPPSTDESLLDSTSLSQYMLDVWASVKVISFESCDASPETRDNVNKLLNLIFCGFIARLNGLLFQRVEKVINRNSLPMPRERPTVWKKSCLATMEITSRLLLLEFVHKNAQPVADSFSDALMNRVYANPLDLSLKPSESTGMMFSASNYLNIQISEPVMKIAQKMDALVVCCCMLLVETPPQVKSSSIERDASRRANARQKQVQGSGHAGLHADIERLFSQRIQIFDPSTITLSVDSIIGTAFKSALKAALEYMRLVSLSSSAYRTVQAEITFLKQVAFTLLRDPSECERLSEQVLMGLFGRYALANDVATASDGAEIMAMSKAVNSAIIQVAKKTVLLPRN